MKKQDKQDNIERQARVNEFMRLQTLSKIYDEDIRYASIKKQKTDLLSKQREETKDALNRKHEIAFAMEQMKITNDFTILQKVMEKQKNAGKGQRATTSHHGGEEEDKHEDGDPRLNQTH